MQVDDIQQAISQRTAIGIGHAFGERAQWRLGMGQMVGLNALAVELAVACNAAHGNAAKVHAVVALLTPNQARLACLPLGTPVSTGHLQRGVCRLRARTRKEHIVQPRRCQLLDLVGQRKRQRVAELKRRGVIQLQRSLGNGVGNFLAAMAQPRAPQT